MSFDAYAVTTRSGPHVTLQAGVVHLGRHWTTASRTSLKSRAVRRHGSASVSTTADDGTTTVIAGPSQVLDPGRPLSLCGAPTTALLSGGAVARLVAGQLEQVVGYLEAGRSVPGAYLPWSRVLLVTGSAARLVLRAGAVREASGWGGGPALRPGDGVAGTTPMRLPGVVPAAAARLSATDGPCWLGVETSHGAVALPARWTADVGEVRVAWAALGAVGARLPGPLCVTIDDSSSRRPDRKVGVLLRGAGAVDAVDGDDVVLSVAPSRISWWDGFSSGSVHADTRG